MTADVDRASPRAARRPWWSRLAAWIGALLTFLVKATLVVALFTFAFFYDRIVQGVYPGQLGVKWSRFGEGTVLDRVYPEGMHLVWPWDEFYIYDMREQELREATVVYARDGLEISARVSIRFRPTREFLTRLHQAVGPDYVEKVVLPESISTLRKVLGNYTPEMIYSKDEEGLLAELARTLREDLNSDYFEVIEFLVLELRLPSAIEEAIKAKLTEEQRMLSYRFRLARERDEKERRTIEAEGLRAFETISGLSILRWRGIEATETLAASANAKIIVMGTGEGQLPVILNADAGASVTPAVASPTAPATPAEPPSVAQPGAGAP